VTSLPRALAAAAPPADRTLEERQVRRAVAGDPAAFRWLFERYRHDVYRLLRDLLGDADAAREGAQETFVRVHRTLAAVRDPARFRAWVLGTARRVSLEQQRRRRRAPLSLDGQAERPARTADPESALIGRESQHVLDAALALLGEERRTALLLAVDHELGYAAIAEIMEWSLAKVKVEIHRARAQLRDGLRSYLEGRR
jgi:RNA polymerase sigma-70 factor (ECF subfamily)